MERISCVKGGEKMVKVCESFNDTAEYFLDRLSQLIDEIYCMDDSTDICGDIYIKQLSEKLCRYLESR